MPTQPQHIVLTDRAYIELVRSLYSTLSLTLIMGISFTIVGATIVFHNSDRWIDWFWGAGLIAVSARIVVIAVHRNEARTMSSPARAGQLERRFAWAYIGFAAAFGIFAARAFALSSTESRLMLVGLVFGYGAGVAAGISLRPWISIPSAVIAIVPMIAVCFVIEHQAHWGVGALTGLFLAGGLGSMLARYQDSARKIMMEHTLSSVERRDELTGLKNKLGLRERFTQIASVQSGTTMVAVHVIHLGGFDDVNARHGYPIGDGLLKAASERMRRSVVSGDAVARLGGVCFTVVQAAIDHPRHANILAEELREALSRPFAVAGGELNLTVSIGYAVGSQRGAALDAMLRGATDACNRADARGGGILHQKQSNWSVG